MDNIHFRRSVTSLVVLVLTSLFVSGCTSARKLPPLPAPERVDLTRFMGDWYVIANIPTVIETDAFEARERYALDPDNSIATTFTFRKGSFDGPLKTYHPRAIVVDTTSNAVWGMRFIWPFRADYRIAHVDGDYQETIIARTARDYVWIMARTPTLPAADYCRLVRQVAGMDYDTTRLRQVPQDRNAAPITCPVARE